jgi:hypothetical protein
MVNNKMKMLDQGEIKYVPEIKEMKKPEYVYKFEKEMAEQNAKFHKLEALKSKNADDDKINEAYRDFEMCKRNNFLYNFLFETEIQSRVEFNQIAKYYNIMPFTPSVMINISPNWNGKVIKNKIGKLHTLIKYYMSEGWYDRWEYVIENGSEGKHIHAHIVAHMNVERIKSVESHLRRGNHTRQLQKWANKIEGMEGLIEGVSVQKVILRTEALVNDKLDYLIEEKKPPGHKNISVIEGGYVKGEL